MSGEMRTRGRREGEREWMSKERRETEGEREWMSKERRETEGELGIKMC